MAKINKVLKNIPQYLPPDEIKKRKNSITKLYHLQEIERARWRIIDIAKRRLFSSLEQITEPQKSLQQQLADIEACSEYEGDYIPILIPYTSYVGIPSAFGCEIIWNVEENKDADVKPLIKHPSDVHHIRKPRITDGVLGKALEHTQYFQEKTKGAYPLRMANVQGPLTNLSLIWGYSESIIAMSEHPKEVHLLLEMITDLMIEFINAQRAICNDFVPTCFYPDWLPDGYGIGIPEDSAAVLSPSFYEEFALPYNNRISEAFNGISLHSCGRSEHNWDVILKHKNLRGINFELPDNSFENMVEKFSGKVVIAPHAPYRRKKFKSDLDYVRYLLERKREDTALFITVARERLLYSYTREEVEVNETVFNQTYHLLKGGENG